MKYLVQGLEPKQKIELLVSMTKIDSENIISALIDHLNRNFSVNQSAMLNDCKQPNVAVALKSLNEMAEKVEKINELNRANFKCSICTKSYKLNTVSTSK
ncbi:MAG: hypothetical protein P8J14_06425 [Emcibacteraceae bacterium]|nr:hypothetical protein [Emcibacteraceae bacterium]